VLSSDDGQRVERVAAAIQPGQFHAAGGEHVQVVVRALSDESSRSTWQCGEGMKPPVLTSTEVSPFDLSTSKASGSGRSCRQAV